MGATPLGCQSIFFYQTISSKLICLKGTSLRVSCIQVTNRAFVQGIKINMTNLFTVVVYCHNLVLTDKMQTVTPY